MTVPLPPRLRDRLAQWLREQSGRGRSVADETTAGPALGPTAKAADERDTAQGEGRAVDAESREGQAVQTGNQTPARAEQGRRRALDMRAVGQFIMTAMPPLPEGRQPQVVEIAIALADMPPPLLPARPGPLPDGWVLIDIETCGLRGMPVFLVGLLDGAAGRVTQLLATNQAAEILLLDEIARRLAAAECALTYNGSAFDLPFLAERARQWRLAEPAARRHTDLLQLMRRRFGAQMPSLRLAAVESEVLGMVRLGDVAGADIPQIYVDFVREPAPERIAGVLAHNFVDLLTCWAVADLLGVSASEAEGGVNEPS